MDLNKEIQFATDKALKEKLPEMVEQKVEKMINSVLSDVFSDYGDIAKDIKSKISESLDVSFIEFSLTDYNSMVSKAIVDEFNKEIDLKPIKDIVRGIVGKSEIKQLKITDLADNLKELAMEKDEHQNYEGEISMHIEENNRHNWTEIYADLEGGKKKEDCAVKVIIGNDNGRIFSMSTTNYRFSTKEISPSDLIHIGAAERFFFNLYNNQVLIINDYEDVYTEWCRD